MAHPTTWRIAGGFLGVALTAVAWALAAAGPTITGARRVAWIAPDGEPIPRQPEGELYPWDGCDMQDIRVSSLRFDDALYTVCAHPTRVPHGGLGRIRAADLASGRAIGEIRWPAPEDLPLAYVAGIAPGPDGRLGVVYRADDIGGRLALGIADREGWACPPRAIGPAGTRLAGAVWLDGAVEVIAFPASEEDPHGLDADAHVLRLDVGSSGGPSCTEATRTVGRAALAQRDDGPPCHPAFALQRADGWRFAAWCYQDRDQPLWEVDEAGRWQVSPWPADLVAAEGLPLEDRLDRAAVGLTDRPLAPAAVLGDAGEVSTPRTPPDPIWERAAAWHHFVADGEALRSWPVWTGHDGGRFGLGRFVGDRFVALWSAEGVAGDPLTLSFPGSSSPPVVTARAPSFSCGELVVGTLLPRTPDGVWLVHPGGCYLGLDGAWRRADPLGTWEHLRRRGSIGMDWHEPWHGWLLGWAMVGLPVAAGLGALGGAAVGRVRSEALVGPGTWVGVWTYVATSLAALWRVLPLMLG